MKTLSVSSPTLKNILLYGLAYLLWFVNIAVSVMALIQVVSTVNVFWVAFGGDRYTVSLVNQVCLLTSGFLVFAYVIFLENLYRESIAPSVGKTSPSHPSVFFSKLTNWRLDILLTVVWRKSDRT